MLVLECQSEIHHERLVGAVEQYVAGLDIPVDDALPVGVMERLGERVFCKVGAEGVFCAALPECGLGVAIKIDDGNNARACEVVMAAVIEAFVALDDAQATFMRTLSEVALSNWNGLAVGQLVAAPGLRAIAGSGQRGRHQ